MKEYNSDFIASEEYQRRLGRTEEDRKNFAEGYKKIIEQNKSESFDKESYMRKTKDALSKLIPVIDDLEKVSKFIDHL